MRRSEDTSDHRLERKMQHSRRVSRGDEEESSAKGRFSQSRLLSTDRACTLKRVRTQGAGVEGGANPHIVGVALRIVLPDC